MVELVERVIGEPAHLLGHSFGAEVVAVAVRRPDLVRQRMNISGGLHQASDIPPATDAHVDRPPPSSAPGAVSPTARITSRSSSEGAGGPAFTPDDVAAITARTLVMAADDDVLPVERFADLYHAIPDGELAIVPGTSHFLLQEKPDSCNAIIIDFLSSGPVQSDHIPAWR